MRRLAPALVLYLFPVFVLALVGAAAAPVIWWGTSGHGGAVLLGKVLIAPLVAAIWFGLRDLRRSRPAPVDGVELRESEHPQLWAEVRALADLAQTDPPSRMVLVPAVDAAVTEVTGRRELILGLPLMATMTVGQLRSVIAHELGHFAGGDTAHAARIARRVEALDALRRHAGFVARIFLSLYAQLYALAAGPASREAERAADRFSVTAAGAETAAEALRHVVGVDLAWSVLEERFLPLFDAAGGRAPLAEGLREWMRRNREDLDAAVAEAIAEQRPSRFDTHPPVRERIAALAAMPSQTGSGSVRAGGDRPAMDLLAGGEPALGRLEAGLFVVGRPLMSWPEVVERGGRQMVAEEQAEVADFLRRARHGDGRLEDVVGILEAAENGDGPTLAEVLGGDQPLPPEEATEALAATVAATVVAQGRGRFRLDWCDVMALVGDDDEPLKVHDLAEESLTRLHGSTLLRGWLTQHGVSAGAAVADVSVRPVWLCALSHLTGPWSGRRDVHVYTTGLLLLPIDPDEEAHDKRVVSGKQQHERLARVAGLPIAAAHGLPGAGWWDREALGTCSVRRRRLKLELEFQGGQGQGPVVLRATNETEGVPDFETVGLSLGRFSAQDGSVED